MMELFVLATGPLTLPITCGLLHHIDCPHSLLFICYIRCIVRVSGGQTKAIIRQISCYTTGLPELKIEVNAPANDSLFREGSYAG